MPSLDIDPDFTAAAAAIVADSADWKTDLPERLRASYDQARGSLAPDVPRGVREIDIPAADGHRGGRLFRPPSLRREDAAILYFHGGGWVVGSPMTHRVVAGLLALRTGLPVFSARYRLAPESSLPAQADDAAAALSGLLAGKIAGVAPSRVVIAGDSAGAAVSFWAARHASDGEAARIAGLVGFYGAYGVRESQSITELGPLSDGLGATELAVMYGRLDPSGLWRPGSKLDPLTAPERPDPPCLLIGSACDPLRDDTRRLAARLGAGAEFFEVPRLPHGFVHFAARVPACGAVLDRTVRWIVGRTR